MHFMTSGQLWQLIWEWGYITKSLRTPFLAIFDSFRGSKDNPLNLSFWSTENFVFNPPCNCLCWPEQSSLNLYRAFPEPSLKLPWIFFRPFLNLHWAFPEPLLSLPWTFTEPSLNLHWNFPEPFLNLHWDMFCIMGSGKGWSLFVAANTNKMTTSAAPPRIFLQLPWGLLHLRKNKLCE